MAYIVYRHTSPSNKVYIGITSRKPEYRWNNGWGYPHNAYFSAAIQKYGWDNFKHEILLEDLTKEQAELAERLFIGYYNSANREHGYNIETGGNAVGKHSQETKAKISKGNKGKVVSDETKRKMSEAQRGHKTSDKTKKLLSEANKGKTHSKEVREKISNALKGENAYWYGKHLPDSTRKKISKSLSGENHPNYGRRCPDAIREKISNTHKKPIAALDKDSMQIMFVCNSLQEASLWVGCSSGNISACCNGHRPTAGGYVWKYVTIKEVG